MTNLTEYTGLDKKVIHAAEPETRPSLRADQRIVRYKLGERWYWCSESEFKRYVGEKK